MNEQVYDESTGEVITIERGNMSIEKEAAKLGIKGAKQGIKILWSWYRPWRTKLAYKREVEAEMKRKASIVPLLVVAFALSGCASLDKVYTAADRTVYNGSLDPYQNQIPEGHMVVKYPIDRQGQRVYIDGWTWGWEMVRKDGYVPPPFTIDEPKAKSDFELVMELIGAKAQAGDSGAADAQARFIEAAKEAGIE
jgi:hypothetical protein